MMVVFVGLFAGHSFGLFAMPIPEMIQCYHLTIFSSLFWIGHSMRVCFSVFVFVCGLVFGLFLLLLCVFCVVLLQWGSDCCGLCTGLPVHLLRPLYGWALCTNSISVFFATRN